MKIQKPSPILERICRAAFPSYGGRKWKLESRERLSTNSYWDGGSKDTFCIVEIATFLTKSIPSMNPLTVKAREPTDIPAGAVIVEHSIFCGKQIGLTVHCRPEDFEQLKQGCIEKPPK